MALAEWYSFGKELKNMTVVYVYADIVVLISIFASVPMLWAVARAYALKFSFGKAIIAASISGVATLCMILFRMNYILMIVCTLVSFAAMIYITFGKIKFRLMCHVVGMLFAETVLLCGFCMLVNNVLSENSRSFISVGCMICGVILLIIVMRMRKSAYAVSVEAASVQNYKITLSMNGRTINIDAVLDSGNMLTEPLSQCPVIILNAALAKRKFNDDIVKPIEAQNSKNVRLVPFRTADSSGIMTCVRAGGVKIMEHDEWRDAGDVYIGISDNINCDALIGTEILNRAI